MRKRKLGNSSLKASALGLGCMGMSDSYGPPKDRQEMIALLHYLPYITLHSLHSSNPQDARSQNEQFRAYFVCISEKPLALERGIASGECAPHLPGGFQKEI
jgi:hypothetical protein